MNRSFWKWYLLILVIQLLITGVFELYAQSNLQVVVHEYADKQPPCSKFVAVDTAPSYDDMELHRAVQLKKSIEGLTICSQLRICVLIDKNGNVRKVNFVETECEIFDYEKIRSSIKKMKFTPAWKNGEPIDYWFLIPITVCLN